MIDFGCVMMDRMCGNVGCCVLLVYILLWGGFVILFCFDEKSFIRRRRICRCIAFLRWRRFYLSMVLIVSMCMLMF